MARVVGREWLTPLPPTLPSLSPGFISRLCYSSSTPYQVLQYLRVCTTVCSLSVSDFDMAAINTRLHVGQCRKISITVRTGSDELKPISGTLRPYRTSYRQTTQPHETSTLYSYIRLPPEEEAPSRRRCDCLPVERRTPVYLLEKHERGHRWTAPTTRQKCT